MSISQRRRSPVKIEAKNVGELIEQLQKLDPALRLGEKDFGGTISPGIELELVKAMVYKEDRVTAVFADDPLWNKRRADFEEPIDVLISW